MSNIDLYRLAVMKNRLDAAILAEVTKRIPDAIRLVRLKKLRLAIKDRIVRRSSANLCLNADMISAPAATSASAGEITDVTRKLPGLV